MRREIKETGFGVKGRTPDEAALRKTDVKHRLFATTMLIFAGIDLLAKFVYGDERRKVEKRFTAFVRNYMRLSRNHAKRLWMVRNAMMHSFGLYTGDNHHVLFTESKGTAVVETLGRQSYLLSLS